MDNRFMIMALVSVVTVFAFCGVISQADDSDALYDEGTLSLSVAQGETATFTWEQAFTMPTGYSSHYFEVRSGTDYNSSGTVSGLTISYNNDGISVICDRSVSAGLYYIIFEDPFTMDIEAEPLSTPAAVTVRRAVKESSSVVQSSKII